MSYGWGEIGWWCGASADAYVKRVRTKIHQKSTKMEKIRTQCSLVVGSCEGLVIWIYQNRTKTGKKSHKIIMER